MANLVPMKAALIINLPLAALTILTPLIRTETALWTHMIMHPTILPFGMIPINHPTVVINLIQVSNSDPSTFENS